ncbi:hypothetical protein AB0B89_08405 [Sphaerisporangium sp. NPDC049002]|uniref:hypothetical protein n=1 Tax=Sphaerisporangium sp. NPDC049002 TaxID=3155392 RepID=UPI003400081E
MGHLAEVRWFIRKLLGERYGHATRAQLLFSELVGNSIRHTSSGKDGSVGVVVLDVGGTLRVELIDGGGSATPCISSKDEFGESPCR